MSLSIVVTTYNRSAVLRSLLSQLSTQTDMDFQVVVAIDGSTDDTEVMLASLHVPFELKWVNTHCRGYGLAVARNLGILAADGNSVAILDDDSVAHDGFVAAHKRSVRTGVITGGPRIPAEAGNERMSWKMRELAKIPPLAPMPIWKIRREWPNAYLIENNICMRRDDFIAMGLFSERLKIYGYIGQEFFARAEFLGLDYQYNPAAAVSHHGGLAGDNGFAVRRKQRETAIANLLRPSLLRESHFRAQVAWANAMANGATPAPPPGFALEAAIALPWRAAKLMARNWRRRLRRLASG